MHRERTERFPAGDARHPHFGMKFLIKSTTSLREAPRRRGTILRELLSQGLRAIRARTNNRPARLSIALFPLTKFPIENIFRHSQPIAATILFVTMMDDRVLARDALSIIHAPTKETASSAFLFASRFPRILLHDEDRLMRKNFPPVSPDTARLKNSLTLKTLSLWLRTRDDGWLLVNSYMFRTISFMEP